LKIKDIATAAQSLANYCYREGEAAELPRIDGALKQLRDRLTVLQQDRVSAMVDDVTEEVLWGEV
jgi:hypothetical protein